MLGNSQSRKPITQTLHRNQMRILSILPLILLPALLQAEEAVDPNAVVPPAAYTERAKVIAAGQTVHVYRLPTTDNLGNVSYYDINVNLVIGDDGVPSALADVGAALSPQIASADFVPGVYTGIHLNNSPATCQLSAAPFAGRSEYTLHCAIDENAAQTLDVTWYTGPIAGHPLEPQLVAAQLNTLPGNEEFAWGRVGFSSLIQGGGFFGCLRAVDLLSVREVNNTLVISRYAADLNLICQVNLPLATL